MVGVVCIFIIVVIVWIYTFITAPQTVYFKWAFFIQCKLYVDKVWGKKNLEHVKDQAENWASGKHSAISGLGLSPAFAWE